MCMPVRACVGACLGEVGDGALADEGLGRHHVPRDVGGEAVAGGLVQDLR